MSTVNEPSQYCIFFYRAMNTETGTYNSSFINQGRENGSIHTKRTNEYGFFFRIKIQLYAIIQPAYFRCLNNNGCYQMGKAKYVQ